MTPAASRAVRGPGVLGLDEDALVACVACGLCLPHCPTYRVTGLELASPRGRIAAMRAVEAGAPVDATFERAMLECVQCRGCEAACPSSVRFGELMEGARAALHTGCGDRAGGPRWRRAAEAILYRFVLPRPAVLAALSWLLLAAQRMRLVPARFGVPRLAARDLLVRTGVPRGAAGGAGVDAWLFTGCVMDAWSRGTHRAAARVLRAAGVRRLARPARGGCCGALHVHAGRAGEARRLARRVVASMPGTAPVVVDSAGCGAAMKEYGRLLGTPEAAAFAARVRDFSEFLAERGGPGRLARRDVAVVVQDPCHLRHVQRAHGAVREVLRAAYPLLETADDGLCCGAGGAYAAAQPELAGRIRDRKVAAIEAAAGGRPVVVASANPGCTYHLRAAGLDVRHPAELLAGAVDDTDPGGGEEG